MSNPSPTCTVQDGAGAPQATTNGTTATAANVITIALASTAGVNSWSLTLFGQDDVISPPVVTVNNTLKTATFTAPALPWSLIYKSTVNGGVDVNGVTQASYSTTFKICCLTAAGKRLSASNETSENNATTGWTSILNDPARNPPVGSVPSGTGWVQIIAGVQQGASAKIPLNNTTYVTGVAGFANGGTGLSALGTGLQVLRTNAGATAMEWATVGGSFTAGTDLAGTSTNQTVVQITGAAGVCPVVAGTRLAFGTNPAQTGAIAVPYASGAVLVERNNTNSADWNLVSTGAGSVAFSNLNLSTAINCYDCTIQAQSGPVTILGTSSVILGTFNVGGPAITFALAESGATAMHFAESVTAPSIDQTTATSGAGANMSILAQIGAASAISGDLHIGGGAASSGGTAGYVRFRNQSRGTSGGSIGGGILLTGVTANTIPVKDDSGAVVYLLCLA